MRRNRIKNPPFTLCLALGFTVAFFVSGCGSTGGEKLQNVILSWQAPESYVDNMPLKTLAGYNVYYGNEPGAYVDHATFFGKATTFLVEGLPYGHTIYFAVTVFDVYGNESDVSTEISVTPPINS